MFGSILGLVGDVAAAQWDYDLLKGAASKIGSYRWGHAPVDEVYQQVGKHILDAREAHAQYSHLGDSINSLSSANVRELRSVAHRLRRDNRYVSTMVDLKAQSVDRKLSGEKHATHSAKLAHYKETLGSLHSNFDQDMKKLNTSVKPARGEALKHTAGNVVNALKIFAYKRPILCGAAMVAALVGIPLAMLFQTVESGYNDAHNIGAGAR